jgi:hypothetical protein
VTHRHFTRVAATEGYPEHRSFRPGEAVPIHAASRMASVDVHVVRAGDADPCFTTERLAIGDHAFGDHAHAVGCGWPVAFQVPTTPDWRPGLYFVHFDDGSVGVRSPAWFVLGGSQPELPLMVLSTNTWNAYNQWGGRCMYTGSPAQAFDRPLEHGYLERVADPDGFDGRVTSVVPGDHDHRKLQEYQRRHGLPLWTASSGWHNWERRFVQWAEGEGVDVDYAIDVDLHRRSDILDGRRLLVTVGHSEYWSRQMRDRVDAFVEAGGNWGIFSGNTCFWQVRIGDDDVMVCHKGLARREDPMRGEVPEMLTSMWSDPLIGHPENTTTGLSFTRGGYHRIGQAVPDGPGGYTVHRPEHWALAGTGVTSGDTVGAASLAVGYEVDGCALDTTGDVPVPTGEDGSPTSLEVIATAPARLISINAETCEAPEALWASVDPPGDLEGTAIVLFGDDSQENIARIAHGHCVMASFTKGRGTVFNAGSADWAYGLDGDRAVQQITRNVLNRLS